MTLFNNLINISAYLNDTPSSYLAILWHVVLYSWGKATLEKYLQLGSTYLGSKTFSMWINPGFSTVYMGTISFAIYIATASVIFFQRAPFLSYRIQFVNVCKTVGCFLAGVLVLPWSCSFRRAQHLSHCLRCCSKLVVLLPLLATDLKQHFAAGCCLFCVWRRKTEPVPNYGWHCVFLRKEFFPACCHVVCVSLWQMFGRRAELIQNYGSPEGSVSGC